jgi:hypothetical protein
MMEFPVIHEHTLTALLLVIAGGLWWNSPSQRTKDDIYYRTHRICHVAQPSSTRQSKESAIYRHVSMPHGMPLTISPTLMIPLGKANDPSSLWDIISTYLFDAEKRNRLHAHIGDLTRRFSNDPVPYGKSM